MIKPLQNYVIIKGSSEENPNGFDLPESIRNQFPEQGEVIAVGGGKTFDNGSRRDCLVAVGQKVIFKKYAADKTKIGEEEYLIIEDTDIVGIVE